LPLSRGVPRLDVGVADAAVEDVPVEGGLEFCAVVGLDDLDWEGQLLEDVVDEADRGGLVEPVVDAQDPQPDAVVDRGELVVLAPHAGDGGDELHIDLDPVAGLRLLIPLPPVDVGVYREQVVQQTERS
jgi:hypothetical protein